MGRHAALSGCYRRRWRPRPRPVLVEEPALVLPDRPVDQDAKIIAETDDDIADPDDEEFVLDVRIVQALIEVGEQVLGPILRFHHLGDIAGDLLLLNAET